VLLANTDIFQYRPQSKIDHALTNSKRSAVLVLFLVLLGRVESGKVEVK